MFWIYFSCRTVQTELALSRASAYSPRMGPILHPLFDPDVLEGARQLRVAEDQAAWFKMVEAEFLVVEAQLGRQAELIEKQTRAIERLMGILAGPIQ